MKLKGVGCYNSMFPVLIVPVCVCPFPWIKVVMIILKYDETPHAMWCVHCRGELIPFSFIICLFPLSHNRINHGICLQLLAMNSSVCRFTHLSFLVCQFLIILTSHDFMFQAWVKHMPCCLRSVEHQLWWMTLVVVAMAMGRVAVQQTVL